MSRITSSNKFLLYVWIPLLVLSVIGFNLIYPIMATEYRPAGSGGGDAADGTVTSDGNNIFSGTNTFNNDVIFTDTVSVSNAAPIFEWQDTTGAEDDFLLSANTSTFSLSNEQDSVTYWSVAASHNLTLGSSSGATILNGANGAVSVSNATPIFELDDTNADDFLLRAQTSVFTLENEQDSVTYLNIDGATSHNITLGNATGATILNGVGGAVSVENATPIFELSDTTGAEDDFLFRAQTSALTIENETDAVTYFSAASTHNITLGSTSGTTTLTSSTSVTSNVPVTVENAAPTFELQDTNSDDFLFQANGQQFDLLNETDGITYFTADANHKITVGSSSGGTVLNGSGGAVSVENATPIFELQDTDSDDFLLRANAQQLTIENETDAVTYFTADSNHAMTLGSSSGTTTLTSSGAVTSNVRVTVENAAPVFELQDSTGAEDDFLMSADASAFNLQNETDAITYLNINSSHGLTLGSSSGSTTVTSDTSTIFTTSVRLPIRTFTVTAGAAAVDSTIFCNASSGHVTVTLPTATGVAGRTIFFKKVDGTVNQCILDGNGGESIDLDPTFITTRVNRGITLISDNADWKIVGHEGKIKRAQFFTATGTWARPVGVREIWAKIVGGGGAGGGADSNALTTAGGGGSGGITIGRIAVSGNVAVTIGTGGAGVANGAGIAGTASTVSGLSGNGGSGGDAASAGGGSAGGAGGTATGGEINVSGNPGANSDGAVVAGHGGNPPLVFQTVQPSDSRTTNTAGRPCSGYGGGGQGAFGGVSTPAGGAGCNGAVIIEWFE